jgi:ketosteroid isomerase-like protein
VSDAGRIVERFFAAQRSMYTGGPLEPVERLLADDVVWHVPGGSVIAGDYVGRAAVAEYFRRRRSLTGATLEIVDRGGVEIDDTVVRLADGRATIGGRPVSWRTAGVYRVEAGRLREAWLVPLDLDHFDQVWSRVPSR